MEVYFNGKRLDDYVPVTSKSNTNLKLPSRIYFWHHMKVNDEVRGYLIQKNSEWEFISCFSFESYFSSLPNKNNTMIVKVALILESPHKDEYSTNYTPIRPANGKTGQRIEEHIVEKIEEKLGLSSGTIYQIYIMNPVQYQASCFHELQRFGNSREQLSLRYNDEAKKCRDEVWKILFRYFKDDFIRRLNSYAPDYVINACTGGLYNGNPIKSRDENKYRLNWIVHDELLKIYKYNKNYFAVIHPSSWR